MQSPAWLLGTTLNETSLAFYSGDALVIVLSKDGRVRLQKALAAIAPLLRSTAAGEPCIKPGLLFVDQIL